MHAFKWKGNEGVGWPATTLQLGNRHAMRWPHIVRNIKSGQMQNIFMYFLFNVQYTYITVGLDDSYVFCYSRS